MDEGLSGEKNVHETLSRQLLPYMKKGVRNNIREEKEGELSTLHLVAKRCLERLSLSPSPRCPSPPTATCDRKERRGLHSQLQNSARLFLFCVVGGIGRRGGRIRTAVEGGPREPGRLGS